MGDVLWARRWRDRSLTRSFALRWCAPGQAVHVFPVRRDKVPNLLTELTGCRASIRNGATQPHVIPYEIGAVGIGLKILHVNLLHLEVSGFVAAVVRFPAFRHGQLS